MRTTADGEDLSIVMQLAEHNKVLGDADKYIDYVHHVENAKRKVYERNLQEI